MPVTRTPNSSKDFDIDQAIRVIYEQYGGTVSVVDKKKNLLKFGARDSVGTGWETVMTAQGSETEETMLTANSIQTIVSSASGDNGKQLTLEYHTYSAGTLTFGTQNVTLDATNATTPVTLPTACARANRLYNIGSSALTGNIYVYESGTRTDANTHISIPAGEQQSQKAQTAISGDDYWIITNVTGSVTEKTSAWAEFRLEVRLASGTYWRPVTQSVAVSDSSGTIELLKRPFVIVPSNYDVRLAARTNSANVSIAGGFSGYLAKVL